MNRNSRKHKNQHTEKQKSKVLHGMHNSKGLCVGGWLAVNTVLIIMNENMQFLWILNETVIVLKYV